MSFTIGETFSNGYTIIKTPTTPGNPTGEYLISNIVGMQYYVTESGLDTYGTPGTYGNGNGGSYGASGSGTITIFEPDLLPGSPFHYFPASTSSNTTLSLANVSGSMVRLNNLSQLPQSAIILGHDNASTNSGVLLFAQQLDESQIIDINVQFQYGLTIEILNASLNSDYGVNVCYDTGSNSALTGYPFYPLPPSASTSVTVLSTPGTCIGLRNNSLTAQTATLIGFDNASTTTGTPVFVETLGPGQTVNIRESLSYGLTVGIVNGPTNSDYGVNILYDTEV